jgi:predicted dehydrogenase
MEKIKFAIIGCGYISTNHIKAIVENHKEAELVSVCDIIPGKAELKANEYIKIARDSNITAKKPSVFLDYKKMLTEENFDACAICTISGYRTSIAIDCMNSKKNILVEKPMAMSLEDADNMIEVAEINNVKLAVSHQNRFKAIMKLIKKALSEKRFGKIISISTRILWNRNREYYKQAKWKGTWKLDGGCFMNQCSHHIDILQWFMSSEIYSIYGQTDNFVHPYIETEDHGNIIIRYKNKAIGNVEGTVCIYPKNLDESLTLIGEKGTVALGGLGLKKILAWDFVDGNESIEEIQKKCDLEDEKYSGKGHTPLYKDFIKSIKNNTNPLIDGREGKKSLEIILMAYKSQKDSKPIIYQKDLKISTTDFIGMLDNN